MVTAAQKKERDETNREDGFYVAAENADGTRYIFTKPATGFWQGEAGFRAAQHLVGLVDGLALDAVPLGLQLLLERVRREQCRRGVGARVHAIDDGLCSGPIIFPPKAFCLSLTG